MPIVDIGIKIPKDEPFEPLHSLNLFAMYGQPGIPMDFFLLTFFHALAAIPVHIIILRARAKDGYTSLYSKEAYVVKN